MIVLVKDYFFFPPPFRISSQVHGEYPVIILHDGLSERNIALLRSAAGPDMSLHMQEVHQTLNPKP